MDSSLDGELDIILHAVGKSYSIKVKPLDPIKSIFQYLENLPSMALMHNNSILIQALSFTFYGIVNGSHIYGIPLESPKEQLSSKEKRSINLLPQVREKYLSKIYHKIKDDDYDEDEIIENPKYLLERSKIKDRIFEKVEGTIKCHRKMIKSFINNTNHQFLSNCQESLYNSFDHLKWH